MAIPAITNNTPAGGISWAAFSIQYMGVSYQISAGSTTQRWVWWRYNGGSSVIEAGADIPSNLTDDDLVLFGNKNGIGLRLQATSLIDGELLVDGSIFSDALSANLINSTHIVTAGLDAAVVKFGTMSGARIAVNTLVGDRITANSIGVSKLMVASMDNLLSDPTFLITTLGSNQAWGTGTGIAISTGTGQAGGNTLTMQHSGTALQSVNYPLDVPVEPNASHRFVGRVKQAGAALPANAARFRVLYYDAAGVLSKTVYLAAPATAADTWVVFSGMSTAPADAVRMRVYLRSEVVNSAGVLHWDYVQMTRAADASLIVDGSITALQIAADTITANEIGAGVITAEEIAAGSITSEEIMSGAVTANHILAGAITSDKLDANAITSTHLFGKFMSGVTLDIENSIHAEPGFLDIKADLMEAQYAIFHNNVTRRGVNNFIEGRETATAGVTDPGTPPTITNVWPFVQLKGSFGTSSLNTQGTRGLYVDTIANEAIAGNVVCDLTSGAYKRTIPIDNWMKTLYARTRFGGWWYQAESDFMGDRIMLRRYSALTANEGVLDTTWEIDAMSITIPGNDGGVGIHVYQNTDQSVTYLGLVWVSQDGDYKIRIYNVGTKAIYEVTDTLPGAAPGKNTVIAGIGMGQFVSTGLTIQPANKDQASFNKFMSGWTVESMNNRVRPYGEGLSAAYGQYTLDTQGRLYSHTASPSNTDGVVRNFTYTWYDSDTTSGSTTAESKASPPRSVAIAKGAYFNFKTPLPPDDGTTDAPNTVRIYINDVRQGAELTPVQLETGVTMSSVLTSGSASPIDSGFAARPQTLPGGYQSTKGDANGPIWRHYGDGAGRSGKHLTWDGNGDWVGEGETSIKLTPTMAVESHNVRIKEILPGVVLCWGYLDVDDSNTNRRDTGMVIPVGMRPAAQLLDASPQFSASGRYRFIFGTDGMIEFEQSQGPNSAFEGFSVVWTTT